MKNVTLWKRLVAIVLATVLAVPAFASEAKVEMKTILSEDFNDGVYSEEIQERGNATLSVTDGVLKVETSQGNGMRAAWVPVEQGKTYTISYDIKVESVSSIQVLAQSWYEENEEDDGQNWSDAQYFENGVTYQGPDFVRKTYVYTVPNDMQRNFMQFIIEEAHSQNATVFYIDNFMIEVAEEIPNLVANGSFGDEVADTTGWDVVVSEEQVKVETTESVLYSRDFDVDYETGFFGWYIADTNTEIAAVDGDNAISFKRGVNSYITYYGTPLETDTTYTIKCMVKASADTYFRVLYDIAGSPHDIKTVGTEWTEYTFTFTASAAYAQPSIYFGIMDDTDNTIYIDDLSIKASSTKTITEEVKTDVYSRDFDNDYDLAFTDWNIDNTNTEIASVDGDNAIAFKKGINTYITYYGSPFAADTTYMVSCKVKATADTYFRVLYDIAGSPHDIKTVGGEWIDYTFTFTTTDALAQPVLYFGIMDATDNTVYIDDVKVQKVEVRQEMEYTDGVGEFGKVGYGLKVSNGTVDTEVTANATNRYEFSVWLKVEEDSDAKIVANGEQIIATETYTDGEWINHKGEFSVNGGLQTFGVEANGIVYVDEIEVYAHIHDIYPVSEKKATCEEEGVAAHFTCSLCDKHFADAEGLEEITEEDYMIPASHDEVAVSEIPSTCTKDGCTAGTKCSLCGTVLSGCETIRAKGHKYDAGKIAKQATCVTTGIKTQTCLNGCGTTKNTTVAKVAMPGKTSISKAIGAKKKVTIKFKKVSSIKGYEIQIATKKNMKKGLKTFKVSAKKSKFVIKGLKAKKKYYVRIRTYKVAGGVTTPSAWSKKKSVKTK